MKSIQHKTAQIIPANPGWYAVFEDADGTMLWPVVAWSANADGQMLPMIDSGDGWVDVEANHKRLVYSPFEIPKDEVPEA